MNSVKQIKIEMDIQSKYMNNYMRHGNCQKETVVNVPYTKVLHVSLMTVILIIVLSNRKRKT